MAAPHPVVAINGDNPSKTSFNSGKIANGGKNADGGVESWRRE